MKETSTRSQGRSSRCYRIWIGVTISFLAGARSRRRVNGPRSPAKNANWLRTLPPHVGEAQRRHFRDPSASVRLMTVVSTPPWLTGAAELDEVCRHLQVAESTWLLNGQDFITVSSRD